MSSAVLPSPAAHVPWRSRTVQVVLASTLLAPLDVPLVAPGLPVYRDVFGVSDAAASYLISAYFVVGVVVSPAVGMVADRVGRKRVLVGSLLAFAATGGAAAFAPSFEALLVLRVPQGTAAAGLFITTVTLEGDVFSGAQRNAVLGVNVAVLSTGAALFPIVGGALVAVAWNLPFLLSAEFAVTALTIGFVITAGEGASIVVSSLNGRFARHLSNVGLVAAGFACYGVGLVVAWVAPSPRIVAVGAAAFGAGLGLSMPAVDAAISDLVTGRYRAEAISFRNSTTFRGRATGPVVFTGLAVITGGYRLLLLAAGGVAFSLAVIAVLSSGGVRGVLREPPPDQPVEQ